MRSLLITFCLLLFCDAPSLLAVEPELSGVEFFEKKIRPVLVKHCYECHSTEADEVKGSLSVDSREGLLRGGDNGPAVVVGDTEQSFLLKALRYGEDDYKMPPQGKLPDDVIADFERWVKIGLPDPREETSGNKPTPRTEINLDEGRKFWAFQPPQQPALPVVSDAAWPREPVDYFVLGQLENVGLHPNSDADRRNIVRRLFFDLIGLPPTVDEMATLLENESPDALSQATDRLLSSPRFGERWGRHWLDVARYADSSGLDQNLTYYNAWRYRDYVIAAFNSDKPFDRFVVEQIAGDLLPSEQTDEQAERLIATGFLMVGSKQLSERDKEKLRMDTVDEQVDTVGRAFLGLTLGCARCHDHKFDPIPTADYYALAGIFRNIVTIDGIKQNNVFVSGWKERPLPVARDQAEQFTAHQEQVKQVEQQIKLAKAELKKSKEGSPTKASPAKVAPASGLPAGSIVVDDADAMLVGSWKPSKYFPTFVGQGYLHDDKTGKGEKSITFTPKFEMEGEYEVWIAYTSDKSGRAPNMPVTIRHAKGEQTIPFSEQEPPTIQNLYRPIGRWHFEVGDKHSVTISNTGTEGFHVVADAVAFVPIGAIDEPLAKKPPASPAPDKEESDAAERKQLEEKVTALEAKLTDLKKKAPPAPPEALAPAEVDRPDDYYILIRGNHLRLGDKVPRGIIRVAHIGPTPTFSDKQSGRRELAEWIARPANPLTARVYVNRVWQHLFGEGLVRSPDNFGLQGERPTHPELLDELAIRFSDSPRVAWSTKALVRDLVLSRTYQQGSQFNNNAFRADAENRWLWRAHRRRLDAESLRDAMLATSGQLDEAMGGTMVADLKEQALGNESKGAIDTDRVTRRSVYLPIIRSDLPTIFNVFDFADPDMVTGRRDTTTVPTQALFLMNNPVVIAQARAAATNLLSAPAANDTARITAAYQRILNRPPTPDETELANSFLTNYRNQVLAARPSKKTASPDEVAWTSFCQTLFTSAEFRFLD